MFFSFSICFGVIAALCCSSPFLFFSSPFRNWAVPCASVSELLFSIPYLFVSVPADLLLFLSVLSVTKPYHFFSNLCLSFPSQLHSVLNISAPQPLNSWLFHCIYHSIFFPVMLYDCFIASSLLLIIRICNCITIAISHNIQNSYSFIFHLLNQIR